MRKAKPSAAEVDTFAGRTSFADGLHACEKRVTLGCRLARMVTHAFLLLLLAGIAFSGSRQATGQKAGEFGDPQVWHWPPSRTYHVENYKLALQFDQAKGEVLGDEVVTLRPFQSQFRKFYLNASELSIDSVELEAGGSREVKLNYQEQGDRLWITLDQEYSARTTLNVRIVYHGYPRIGLFFVNPTAEYPKRPREIYSQGEPELNHFWFPCWDYPNDMATSETITTVPEGQTVVSNGRLVKATHAAGQVTYDWVEGVPHSSYLISIAIGPWRKVSDSYQGKPVDYYVPNYVDEETARRSFHLTPDMIGFFSRASGLDYPYEQYAQTAVHNFIFGGQENVSATTLTENTLHDARADRDYPSTTLVSHELGQEWFGDYVQGRDWANIWLNEGFATYLEALYTQHHEGNDAYRLAMYEDQMTEQEQQRSDYLRPIVDRHYNDPLDMFDTITHEKGAAVLDMLRYLVDGAEAAARPASQDEPLFRALHSYLVEHGGQTADTDDLMKAIRESTGLELGWFFREWVFQAGHPDYQVKADYDAAAKTEKLTITQVQGDDAQVPVFDMPIELEFWGSTGQRKKIEVRDHLRQQQFAIALEFKPLWVDFDPDDVIDKTVEFEQPLEALAAKAEKDPWMMSRLFAVQQIGASVRGKTEADSDTRVDVLEKVLGSDPFHAVRAAAATSLGEVGTAKAQAGLLSALSQSDSRVRAAAIKALGEFSKRPAVFDALVKALRDDSSYAVEAAAAQAIGESGNARAFDVLQAEAARNPEVHVMQAALAGLAATRDSRSAAILVAQARPGVPDRVRVSALQALAGMNDAAMQEHRAELIEIVGAALTEPFFPVQAAGEQLAGAFGLTEFRKEIEERTQGAPAAFERDAAQEALGQLRAASKRKP